MFTRLVRFGIGLAAAGLLVSPAMAATNSLQTVKTTLTLLDHEGNGINGARVDLLKENGSGAGAREETDTVGEAAGVAAFEVLPNFRHAFRVRLNGGTLVTPVVEPGEDVVVQTHLSQLVLADASGSPLENVRVDMLQPDESGTGQKGFTDDEGKVGFEVLPGCTNRFRIRFNNMTHVTELVPCGQILTLDLGVSVPEIKLVLTDPAGDPVDGVRIDLLKENGKGTGQRLNTGEDGQDPGSVLFPVLPEASHQLRIRYNNDTYVVDASAGDVVDVQLAELKLVLKDPAGGPVDGVRVDLLRENGKGTGQRLNTGEDGQAPGTVAFAVLPGAAHQLRIRHNNALDIVDASAGDVVAIDLVETTLTVLESGAPLNDVRVDLLRVKDEEGNTAGTGQRDYTDVDGKVKFAVLPSFQHRMQLRIKRDRWSTEVLVGSESVSIDIDTQLPDGAVATKLAVASEDDAPAFGLDQNHPNPFNPSTTIGYTLPEAANVRLVIYNVLGQEVRELVNDVQSAGRHQVRWDGRDAFGRQVATGLYISRLVAGTDIAIRKMTFSK